MTANNINEDDFEVDFEMVVGRSVNGTVTSVVVVAKGAAAAEFLPVAENFKARTVPDTHLNDLHQIDVPPRRVVPVREGVRDAQPR